MQKMITLVSASALAIGLIAAPAFAAHQKSPVQAQVASPAQLAREHQRAVKAGDTANDPSNSASSDSLNQQQLQGTPIAMTSDTMTAGANAQTATPSTDAQAGTDATAQTSDPAKQSSDSKGTDTSPPATGSAPVDTPVTQPAPSSGTQSSPSGN